jgi:methyltransferase (TIGR00027 family)
MSSPYVSNSFPYNAVPTERGFSADQIWENEEELNPGVEHTARWAAALRAIEQDHPQALIVDPLARTFAGESAIQKVSPDMDKIIASDATGGGHSHIAIRARAFDDILTEEVECEHQFARDVVQVVNLGAGMCTRAWRVQLHTNTSWFEVDRPESIKLRKKLLDNISNHPLVDEYNMVPVDFNDAKSTLSRQLQKYRFDPTAPTIVIMEGLLMYIDYPEIRSLASELNELIRGPACLIVSALNAGFLNELRNPSAQREKEYPSTGHIKDLFVSSWEGGTQEAFEEAGWTVDFVVPRETYAETYLNCEMLEYPFPDRRTSTELFVIMRRQKVEGIQAFIQEFFQSIKCQTDCRAV